MSILDWLSHGLLNLSPWGVVLAALILTHITIVSVTVYFRNGTLRFPKEDGGTQHVQLSVKDALKLARELLKWIHSSHLGQ